MRVITGTAALALVGGLLGASPAHAAPDDVVVLSTDQAEVHSGTPNQGWWSTNVNRSVDNPNYLVGLYKRGHYRNFFTFDLSGVTGQITSLTLVLQRRPTEDTTPATYRLYDVTTPAAALTGTGQDAAIYGDLGSGTQYGYYSYAGSERVRYLRLNAAAVAAANAARGGYFSIGGTTNGAGGLLFGRTGFAADGNPQRLEVTVAAP